MITSARARAVAIVAVAIMALSAIPGPVATASGEVILEDGQVLTSSIFATTIKLPVGATVYYGADIILSAADLLEIEGQLRDQDAGSAHDIILEGGNIVITGNVIARDGASAPSAASNMDASGAAGSDGGSITIRWADLKSFTLASGATLQSGSGGAGGEANATADGSTGSTMTATGGKGGNGGAISITGATAFINGQLVVGNGGKGGDVLVWDTLDAAGLSGGLMTATGGDGGDAGEVTLPTGFSLVGLHTNGQVSGSEGGDGGAANAGDIVAASCSDGQNGAPGSWGVNNGRGGDGCKGTSRSLTGGQGGCTSVAGFCLFGGLGGNVGTFGGNGGRGGNGADGTRDFVGTHMRGGDGGNGGNGGDVSVTGGRGGHGILMGGRGGDASGDSGRGGDGGTGGLGGELYGWTGGLGPPSCYGAFICWGGVGVQVLCGHVGKGSSAGGPGYRSVSGGSPGSSTTGLNGGHGTASGSSGGYGTAGSPGTYNSPWNCDHRLQHTHL